MACIGILIYGLRVENKKWPLDEHQVEAYLSLSVSIHAISSSSIQSEFVFFLFHTKIHTLKLKSVYRGVQLPR